ncbi:MAG TPA: GNAT family N-acetyltransferase [Candidatus Saccharimonadales bacterium]|nr:GNAT family N-acetyltransferase [Candidatus Saccharimonadales bacterium]
MDIFTPRLRLHPLCEGDIDDLVSLHADSEVMRGSSGVAEPRDRAVSEQWLARTLAVPRSDGWATYRVDDRTTGSFLGRCGLRPEGGSHETELAYAFTRATWGRGIATEAAVAVVWHGFEAGLARIVGCALVSNAASLRVLEKVGMRRTHEEFTSNGVVIHCAVDRAN